MATFLHKFDPKTGRSYMEQVEVEYDGKKFEIKTPEVTPAKIVKVWECTGCETAGTKFRSAGVAAMHFRRHHPDLNEKGLKETWKDYFEVRNESHSQ
jgi:hypothetical protein